MKVNRFIDEEFAHQRDNLPVGTQAPQARNVNICGVLVHARPERITEVRAALESLSGVEIHANTDDGRLVVTVEDTEEGLAADGLAAIGETSGVLSTSLVYHHFQPEESMEQEEASS